MRINVTRSSMPPMEEYVEEIRSLWDSHWLTNNGEKLKKLEAALKERLDVPYAALFTNGHLALEALLKALGLKGEVITTPFTFASTTHAIVRAGLTPVFCDIREDDYTMDPAKVEALITPRTCAILPVHVYGNLCDDGALSAIAKKHGLKLIYDAAHAFHVSRDGVSAARMGDAAMFSFHATKVFHTVEGGCVTTADPELNRRLEWERNYGIEDEETVLYPGGNAKMSEFHAAMGLCNLRHLDENIEKRRHVVELYDRLLSGHEGDRLPEEANGRCVQLRLLSRAVHRSGRKPGRDLRPAGGGGYPRPEVFLSADHGLRLLSEPSGLRLGSKPPSRFAPPGRW